MKKKIENTKWTLGDKEGSLFYDFQVQNVKNMILKSIKQILTSADE